MDIAAQGRDHGQFHTDSLFNLILDQLDAGLVLLDSDQRIQWVNQPVNSKFGLNQELIGEPVEVLFSPTQIHEIEELLSQPPSEENSLHAALYTRDEIRRQISIYTPTDLPNSPRAIVFHELEDNQIGERDSKSLPIGNETLDTLPVAVMTFDLDHTCKYLNPAAERLFEVHQQAALGKHLKEILIERQSQFFHPDLNQVLDPGSTVSYVHRFKASDGSTKLHRITVLPQPGQWLLAAEDITGTKNTDRQIMRIEAESQIILESMFVKLAVINRDGKVVFATKQMAYLLGFQDSAELVGARAVNFVCPEEQAQARRVLANIQQNHHDEIYEFTLIGKDARRVLVRIHPKLVPIPGNQHNEILLSFEDITEKRRAEQIQAAVYKIADAAGQPTSLEDLYATIHTTIQSIMPASNFYIAIYDKSNEIISFPYFVDEVDAVPEPLPAKQLEKSITMYVIRTGESLLCPKHISDELYAAGEVKVYGAFPAIWLGVPLLIDGDPIGVMAVQHYTDANAYTKQEQHILEFVSTEVAKAIQKKQSERALIDSEKRFRSVVHSTPIGFILFRVMPDGKLIFITSNPAAEKIQGRALSNLVGKPFEKVFPGLFELDFQLVLKEIANNGGQFRKEIIQYDQAGGIASALEVNAFRPSINEVALHFQDITKRVQTEEEISNLNEDLEQRVLQRTVELEASNREMEAFAYSVSHDLRAPVRAIKGFSEILLAEEQDREKKELINRIADSGSRMDQLINDLLSLSRLGRQTLNLQLIDLSDISAELLAEFVDNSPDRVIEYHVSETPRGLADQDMVRILLNNLISNAVKFSAGQDPSRICFGHKNVNGQAAYYLEDNGVGFDMKYAEKVFSAFERLHASEYEGTGIGLAIASRVIRRHGGNIWVETAPDCGATFYFTLQRSPKD